MRTCEPVLQQALEKSIEGVCPTASPTSLTMQLVSVGRRLRGYIWQYRTE